MKRRLANLLRRAADALDGGKNQSQTIALYRAGDAVIDPTKNALAPSPGTALYKAIKAVGSTARLAEELGITTQAISQWRRAPVGRVLAIEKATNGKVRRSELRPDIYPPESDLP